MCSDQRWTGTPAAWAPWWLQISPGCDSMPTAHINAHTLLSRWIHTEKWSVSASRTSQLHLAMCLKQGKMDSGSHKNLSSICLIHLNCLIVVNHVCQWCRKARKQKVSVYRGKKSWPLRERTITKSNFYLTLKASNLFDQNKNTWCTNGRQETADMRRRSRPTLMVACSILTYQVIWDQ